MLPIPTRTIAQTTLTGTSTSETLNVGTPSLPFTHRHLVFRWNAQSDNDNTTISLFLQLNGDTGANYNVQRIVGAGSSDTASRGTGATSFNHLCFPGDATSSSAFGGGELLIPDAFSTRTHKSMIATCAAVEDNLRLVTGRWANTDAITSVTVLPQLGNFVAGSFFELAVVDEMFAIPGAETILA